MYCARHDIHAIVKYFYKLNLCEYCACRPYTRQCLPNASVATVGPTLGPNASLRAIRQKREMETRGEQDNQDKSDLQGKIQFYQQFCASQSSFGIAERKTQRNAVTVGRSQQPIAPAGNESAATVTARRVTNPCEFSTFKSTKPGSRTAMAPPSQADVMDTLDLSGLNLGPSSRLELGPSRTAKLKPATTSREYYQPIGRTRERSPNAPSRQLDKQSYFFHGHKTEKNIDREVVMLEDLEAEGSSCTQRADDADDAAATSGGSMNCFGSPDKELRGCADYVEDDRRLKCPATSGARRHAAAYETRRDSSNVQFLEKEGEIFKKSSTELLQEATGSKRRNFSFRSKEKTHRSLESLEKSVDLPAADCKSLDLLPEERPKMFFHRKQVSLDSSQKLTKKSADSPVNKSRKRPSFLQRVGRSLHLLPKEREKRQDLLQREEQQPTDSQYPQTDQEKCEYFLQRRQKDADFFEQPPNRGPNCRAAPANVGSFDETDAGEIALNSSADHFGNVRREESTFRLTEDPNNIAKVNIVNASVEPSRSVQSDGVANNVEQSRLLDPVASVATQETVSGNKDSLEIGYSISQLGRLYMQNLQHVGRADGLQSLDNATDAEKRDCYIEWITRNDLDALSHGTNSSDSLAHGKPQGNMDILKGILLDIFVCIC